MSDMEVIRGTGRRRSIFESGHPSLNSTVLDSDVFFDSRDLINTRSNANHRSHPIITSDDTGGFIESPMGIGTSTRLQTRRFPVNSDKEFLILSKLESLKLDISNWQSIIEYDLITVESIKNDHTLLKGEIQALYQESIYAHAPERLSNDIIGLVSLIDRLKIAALRLIRNEEHMAETARVNNVIANNAKQCLSQSAPPPLVITI